jgi:translation initiation factor 2 subunit 1
MEARSGEPIYPSIGTVTVAFIREIKEMGAYCLLSEYGNSLGMLMMSELSRKRIRSLNKFIKTGKTEVVVVIRVNLEKGYIDLSKRRIADGETFSMEKKWSYNKFVNSIITYISDSIFINNEDMRLRWLWPITRNFSHPMLAFKKLVNNSKFINKSLDFFKGEKQKLLTTLDKKISVNLKKISSSFEINCFSWAGISRIKEFIKVGLKKDSEKKIDIKLIAGSTYSITVKDKTKKKALISMLDFYGAVTEKIKNRKGWICVKTLI